jgi:hypothetical protein
MSEWQPIETAPTDGTEILAILLEDYKQVVFACGSSEGDEDEGPLTYWKSIVTDRYVLPTHWIPLPPLPSEGERDA